MVKTRIITEERPYAHIDYRIGDTVRIVNSIRGTIVSRRFRHLVGRKTRIIDKVTANNGRFPVYKVEGSKHYLSPDLIKGIILTGEEK